VLDFLISVERGKWVSRDLQQVGGSLFFPSGAFPDMPESLKGES